MSSLRNSLHRRNHKERSQLAHRSRLGILEKHKDYVLRARDYHSKQDRLTRLRQKAADRNKDEFYFGMNNQRTQKGVHIKDRGNSALPVDMVKVLKSQDENYIRTMRTAGLKKIEKIKEQLSAMADLLRPGSAAIDEEDEEEALDEEDLEILQEAGIIIKPSDKRQQRIKRNPKHIVFAEDEAEARQLAASRKMQTKKDDDAMVVEDTSVDLGWKTADEHPSLKKRKSTSASRDKDEASTEGLLAAEERRELSTMNRSRLLKELSARLHRDKMLRYAEREMEMQKLLMGKGASTKLQGVERVGGKDSDDEDEADSFGGRRGKRASKPQPVDEKAYKPRVYKWRAERKR
ncbi:u3 small nucleolar RNA-associated protein 11 [Dentipellis sp. KUC8613]|nr:u3 small nucleolar RNA-associated protein 11 [Dentipellis sp. KUC8613]